MSQIDPIALLKELVAVPSVNPMGAEPNPETDHEFRLTEYLERFLGDLAIPTVRRTVEPGRDNLLARIDGAPGDGTPLIVFDAHQDTVPAQGMTIPPWTPNVRGGRLFGRGSCDTKGPMAAMIAAAVRLLDVPIDRRPTLVLSFPVNEEFGFTGIGKLCEDMQGGEYASLRAFLPRTPDAAIVGEPTNLAVIKTHKGAVRWRIHTRGRAAHSSKPSLGENAIFKMADVLKRLEDYQRDVVETLASDPFCGPATLSVGTIRGGVSVNVVPDDCVIEIDRRVVPGEDSATAREHVIATLGSSAGLEHRPPFLDLPPLEGELNGPLAERLSGLVHEQIGRGEITGATYGTHAAFYAGLGVPAIVFGPGSIEQAHTEDEWVSTDQVLQATEILWRFLASHF